MYVRAHLFRRVGALVSTCSAIGDWLDMKLVTKNNAFFHESEMLSCEKMEKGSERTRQYLGSEGRNKKDEFEKEQDEQLQMQQMCRCLHTQV